TRTVVIFQPLPVSGLREFELAREADDAAPHPDEAVRGQRGDRLLVQRAVGARPLGDELKRRGAPLAERAFEAALLAEGLVATPAGRARAGERAGLAARDPRETDRRAEVHERMRRVRAA